MNKKTQSNQRVYDILTDNYRHLRFISHPDTPNVVQVLDSDRNVRFTISQTTCQTWSLMKGIDTHVLATITISCVLPMINFNTGYIHPWLVGTRYKGLDRETLCYQVSDTLSLKWTRQNLTMTLSSRKQNGINTLLPPHAYLDMESNTGNVNRLLRYRPHGVSLDVIVASAFVSMTLWAKRDWLQDSKDFVARLAASWFQRFWNQYREALEKGRK